MKKDTIITAMFILSLSCFIAISLLYNYIFLCGNQNIVLLFPESSTALVIVDDNQSSFWYPWKGSILSDDPNIKIRGLNSLMINVNIRPHGGLFEYRFESPQNWSDKDFFTFYLYGQKSGHMFRIHVLTPDWDNRGYFDFYDNFKGWKKLLLPLHKPTEIVGNYNLSKVKRIIWALPNVQATGTWHLDRVAVEEETIWLTLLANLEETLKILVYSSATALALSGIIMQKIKESRAPPESKAHLKDFILYAVLGLISGLLVWFILEDMGWLAYIISLMTAILTITLSILSQKEANK